MSALLPILMAGISIVFAFAGTYLFGQGMEIADLVTNVITLVGIAIGIDYALLGLAVLVALPVPFIRSMGIGGMLVPVSAVLAALTVLPAVLAALGPRVDALRVYPRRWRLRDGALWGPLARAITGWAVPVAAVVLIGLVALAGQSANLGMDQDELADAPDVASVQAGRLGSAELGGTLNPNTYVIDTGSDGGAYDPATIAALSEVADDFRAEDGVVSGATWPSARGPEAFRAAAEGGLVDDTGRYALMQVAPRGDLMLFAFLFGISMDYQVLLVERMRELRDGGEPNRRAVRLGLASTGRIVATAALIMVVAFGGCRARHGEPRRPRGDLRPPPQRERHDDGSHTWTLDDDLRTGAGPWACRTRRRPARGYSTVERSSVGLSSATRRPKAWPSGQ